MGNRKLLFGILVVGCHDGTPEYRPREDSWWIEDFSEHVSTPLHFNCCSGMNVLVLPTRLTCLLIKELEERNLPPAALLLENERNMVKATKQQPLPKFPKWRLQQENEKSDQNVMTRHHGTLPSGCQHTFPFILSVLASAPDTPRRRRSSVQEVVQFVSLPTVCLYTPVWIHDIRPLYIRLTV
jgi:hypothetical protein